MQGVPAYGIVDSGSDVTIIGGELFKRVASIAKLQKRDFKQCDKVPHNYDCLLYTSPSPRDATLSRMPSSA